jgi:hypothetical protein
MSTIEPTPAPFPVRQPPPRLSERTPLDWRTLLLARLNVRATEVDLFESYYDGAHPLQFATSKYREAFGNLFGAFADNWCQLVVDAPVERLKIVGFRTSKGDDANEDAWAIWQRNSLDVESVIAHTEAGKTGRCYLLVDPNDGEPRITVEHGGQMIVAHDPGDRRKRLAALKRWKGDDGFAYATLYLPDVVLKFESKRKLNDTSTSAPLEWVPRRDDDAEVTNPLGVVPVIPLENKPGLGGKAHSDLDPAIPLQNAVNKLCSDMIVASEYGAFPQRVVTGVEVPKDPETGQPLAATELKSAMSRLWTFKPADAAVSSLPATDLSNFVTAIEMLIQHLAAQTRTPPHYLLAKMVNTSGDALAVAEAGLVAKCRTKALFFSDSWEEAIALALTATGKPTEQSTTEAIWSNPERVSQAVAVDAATKKKTLGIPLPVIWLELGYTPDQIAEMTALEESASAAQLEANDALDPLSATPLPGTGSPTPPVPVTQ